MASELGYVTAAELRKGCSNVDPTDFTDSDLDGKITNSEHFVHVAKNRSTSNPWTTAEDEFELVKRVVFYDAKAQVYDDIDNDDEAIKEKESAEKQRDRYLNLLLNSNVGQTGSFEKTSGVNNQATDSEPGTFA